MCCFITHNQPASIQDRVNLAKLKFEATTSVELFSLLFIAFNLVLCRSNLESMCQHKTMDENLFTSKHI